MDHFVEIVILLGERLTSFQAELPSNPQTEEINRKGFYIVRVVFMVIILAIASIIPIGIGGLALLDGQFSTIYLGLAASLAFATVVASIFIFPKISLLIHQYSQTQSVQEMITVQDDIKYELGIELLLFILTFIPIAHIIFCSLTVDRAINIIEITDPSRQRIRKNAANIAGFAILVFMANSFVVSLITLIMGANHR